MNISNARISIPEIMIIAVIICVVGFIVTPAFTKANAEAKISDLTEKLESVRNQIELYRVQHDGLLPGQRRAGGSIDKRQFVNALTEKGPDGMGPYLEEVPVNPFNESDSISVETWDDGKVNGAGWCFNSVTGEFRADDNVGHSAY